MNFIYAAGAHFLNLRILNDMDLVYYTYKSGDSPEVIEVDKRFSAYPKSSTMLSYVLEASNDSELREKVKALELITNSVNGHNDIKKWTEESCMKVQGGSLFAKTDDFKAKLLSDKAFWTNLLKPTVVKVDVSLDTFMAYESIAFIMKVVLKKDLKAAEWPVEAKQASFISGFTPKSFCF
jgi:hypothetical protein